jgi:hypothetical protein
MNADERRYELHLSSLSAFIGVHRRFKLGVPGMYDLPRAWLKKRTEPARERMEAHFSGSQAHSGCSKAHSLHRRAIGLEASDPPAG